MAAYIVIGVLFVAYMAWWLRRQHLRTKAAEKLKAEDPKRYAELQAAAAAKRANAPLERRLAKQRKSRPISVVGKTDTGGIACPKCGGAQFKARRSTKARAGVVATGVVGLVATKQKQVTCVTCGTRYGRG